MNIENIISWVDGLFGPGTFAFECRYLDDNELSSRAKDDAAKILSKWLETASIEEINQARRFLNSGVRLIAFIAASRGEL